MRIVQYDVFTKDHGTVTGYRLHSSATKARDTIERATRNDFPFRLYDVENDPEGGKRIDYSKGIVIPSHIFADSVIEIQEL
jgi:hypothetical protein